MGAVVGGLVAGLAFGAWISRNKVCFNNAVRSARFEGEWSIMRIFAIAVAVQLLLLPVLVLLNVDLFSNSSALPAIGLFPVSQVVGGLVFGAGMALAGGCIAGILWKSGAGSIATAIAIGGFIVGELLIRGPFDGLLTDLDYAVDPPADQTLYEAIDVEFVPIALLLGAGLLLFVLRRGSKGLAAGVGLGLIGILTWVLAGWGDYGYGLGFVGAAENARVGIVDGGTISFAVFLAIGTVAGAALAIRGPLRMPDRPRAVQGGDRRPGDGRRRHAGPRLQHRQRPDRDPAALAGLDAGDRDDGARRDRRLAPAARRPAGDARPRDARAGMVAVERPT